MLEVSWTTPLMWVRAENLCKRPFVVTIFKRQFFLILFSPLCFAQHEIPPSSGSLHVGCSYEGGFTYFIILVWGAYLICSSSGLVGSRLWLIDSCLFMSFNSNSVLSGSADVLREKAALWLFTFLDIYFLLACLGISFSLSFEFFDVSKKMILTESVWIN